VQDIAGLFSSGWTWIVGAIVALLSFTWFTSAQNSRINSHEERLNKNDVRMASIEASVNSINMSVAQIKVICEDIADRLKTRH
jgi:hypothetical protein